MLENFVTGPRVMYGQGQKFGGRAVHTSEQLYMGLWVLQFFQDELGLNRLL